VSAPFNFVIGRAPDLRRRCNGGKRRALNLSAGQGESFVSRASLIDAYVSALPFAAVIVVAVPRGGCRVAVGGEPAPGEKIERQYYFKASHIELVLGAAGLTDGPIDQPPATIAALVERTARSMQAPFQTAAELRADAEKEVAKIIARVEATKPAAGCESLTGLIRRTASNRSPGPKKRSHIADTSRSAIRSESSAASRRWAG
jgi:hypothetical protein